MHMAMQVLRWISTNTVILLTKDVRHIILDDATFFHIEVGTL